jgi:predicted 3-demethylubiquinone-9 3-methyltransferase (glyoxalase superfamily)
VECDNAAEVDHLFAAMSEGGKVLMGLDRYPFASRFGWVNDRFGVSWQVRFS